MGAQLRSAIASWAAARGGLPPSSTLRWSPNDNMTNLGSESLYYSLANMMKRDAPLPVPIGDTDGDRRGSPSGIELGLEYVDAWGNPFVYVCPRGDDPLGELRNAGGTITPVPVRLEPARGDYVLRSMGPDGKLGTRDDLVLE